MTSSPTSYKTVHYYILPHIFSSFSITLTLSISLPFKSHFLIFGSHQLLPFPEPYTAIYTFFILYIQSFCLKWILPTGIWTCSSLTMKKTKDSFELTFLLKSSLYLPFLPSGQNLYFLSPFPYFPFIHLTCSSDFFTLSFHQNNPREGH